MPAFLLHPEFPVFPHPLITDEPGILAVGGDLTPERLVNAYRFGIFPWYSEFEPVMWWFPDPRCILYPSQLKVSKSMRSVLRNGGFKVTYNCAFATVIRQCASVPRPGQAGTWLTEKMIGAYIELHNMGYAHSAEVWKSNKLVGGLYGISLGRIFFGESMFSKESNASKAGFIHLVRELKRRDFRLIDCQQDTPHLRSLGATTIPAKEFYAAIRENHIASLTQEKLQLQVSSRSDIR